jgi:hypothetical protein
MGTNTGTESEWACQCLAAFRNPGYFCPLGMGNMVLLCNSTQFAPDSLLTLPVFGPPRAKGCGPGAALFGAEPEV